MITTPQLITTREIPTAVIPLKIPCQDMSKHMDPAIQEVIKTITGQGRRMAGPMFCYHQRRPSDSFDLEVGFPVTEVIKSEGRVKNSKLPAVKVARAVYQGSYEGLGPAWQELQAWVRKHGHGETGRFWESYLTNPEEVKDANSHLTELNWIIA